VRDGKSAHFLGTVAAGLEEDRRREWGACDPRGDDGGAVVYIFAGCFFLLNFLVPRCGDCVDRRIHALLAAVIAVQQNDINAPGYSTLSQLFTW